MPLMPGIDLRLLPPGVNHSGGVIRPPMGVIVHVIVGSLDAADGLFHRPSAQASAHFGVGKDGHIIQWVDTNDKAWTEAAGNPYWISIETEGFPDQPYTPAQIDAIARVIKWVYETHGGFPLNVTDSPAIRGIGTHSMGGAAWGGHECPGAIRAGQRPAIIQRVRDFLAPVPAPPPHDPHPHPGPVVSRKADPMFIFQLEGHPHTFICKLDVARWHHDADDHNTSVWELAVAGLPHDVTPLSVAKAIRYPLVGDIDPILLTLGFKHA